MLKLNYNDMGLFMERVNLSLEELMAQRALLAVQSGQPLHIEPGTASFLLPSKPAIVSRLETALWIERHQSISLYPVDVEFVEVSVRGTWMATNLQSHEGTFIAVASWQVESMILQLWQLSQLETSPLV